MKIINHNELQDNTTMYLDLARTEDIIIRRGKDETLYIISREEKIFLVRYISNNHTIAHLL